MLGGSGLPPLDLSVLLQFAITALALVSGLLFVVRSAASRYFVVDARFESDIGGFVGRDKMSDGEDKCFVCDRRGTKKCSRCKGVRYCSQECQSKHWKGGHNRICKEPKVFDDSLLGGTFGRTKSSSIALVPSRGSCKVLGLPKKVLFPYDEFVKLFNWDKHIYPPCGLLNCGNSCFANVILQCLACTRPLVAYLLEGSHFKTCGRNDWCFLCELRNHIQNVSQSMKPFSPMNILDRLPKIGGNLGHGRQEDAHEFMRLAIDTMQSVCLDEFGGEKALDPSIQETTLIQHIFGGHLQSQVKCTKCDKISNRYENMMDLTVEIQGDAESLEECLNQFTGKEWLDGENMYKCEGCDEYVKAWKRLTVHQPPNVLTVALKRFQSGRFGKLNKRVTFPVTLDLVPYMSEARDNTDLYELYAVVVHIDMLNASFFGHYICYTKDFHGNWYRVDDCKVTKVDVEEVLAQGAYMLLYSRKSARQPHIREPESSKIKDVQSAETDPCNMVSANSMEHELERETVRIRADTASDLHVPNNIKGDIGVEESGDVDKSSFINTDVDKPLETDEDQFLKKDLVESEDSCSSGPTKDGLECSAAKYLDGGLPEGNILFQEEFGTKAVNLLTSVDDRFPKENVGSTSMPEETFKDGIIGTSFCPSTAALDGVPELKESDPAGPSREHTDPVDDSSDPGTAVIDLQDNTFSSGSTSNGEVKQHSSDCFLEQEPAVGEATSTGNGAGHSRLYSCNRLGSGDLNSGEDLQRNGSPDENAQMKSQVTGAGETTRRTEVKSTSAGIPAGDGNCNGVLHGPENLSAEDGWRRPSSSAFLSYEAQKLVLNGGAETDSSKVCSPCKMPADRNEKAPMGNGQVDFRDHSRPSREQEKSRSRGRRKPLFPRGFLDQHAEARTVEGKSQKEGAIPQMGNGDRTATSCSTQSTLQNGEKYDPIRSPLPENGIGMVLCSADVPLVSNGGFPSKSSEKTLKNAAKSQNGYAIPSKSSCNGG